MPIGQDIIDRQGWDSDSLISLMEEYIIAQGSEDTYLDFLQHKAAEEDVADE